MAALCAATAIISVVVPFAGALSLLGTVPMGLLAYRYRLRVLIAATVAAGLIAFLIAGLGGLMTVGQQRLRRRADRRRQTSAAAAPRTVIVVSLLAGAVFNAFAVAALARALAAAAPDLRCDHRQHQRGCGRPDGDRALRDRAPFPLSGRIGDGLDWTAHELQWFLAEALHYWPWLIFANGIVSIVVVSLIGWWALSRVLDRMRGIPDVHKLDALDRTRRRSGRFRCGWTRSGSAIPNTDHDALRPVNLDVKAGEHVAITGANGSGKTTLMLVLAGREPTSGTIERPGAVGLGRLGGTAVVMQHPGKSGAGHPGRRRRGVGPAARDDRSTSTGCSARSAWRRTPSATPEACPAVSCSGWRVAAALAREPALLIADEVTSMVDQEGREALLGVLSGLTQRHRTALVHITHYNNEAESADRTINLSESGGQHRAWSRPVAAPVADAAVGPRVRTGRSSSSSASATNTAAARRGPRPRCATSTSRCTKATGC